MDHIFSLAVLEDYLYWSEWSRHTISRVHKVDGGPLEILRNLSRLTPAMQVVAYYDIQCKCFDVIRITTPLSIRFKYTDHWKLSF